MLSGRQLNVPHAENGGVYVPCIYRMPGGVIGDSVSVVVCLFNVWLQLVERN